MTPTATADSQIIKPETENKKLNALQKVNAWVVKTVEDYTALDAYLVYLLEIKKMVVADFKESIEKSAETKRAATAAHKALTDQEGGHLTGIDEARRVGKNKLTYFEQEQEAERKRLQDEADAKARKEAEDRALEAAAKAEQSGDTEKADAILEEPAAPILAPRIASSVPQRSTIVSTRWGATIGGPREDGTKTDPLFVLKALEAAGKVLAKSKGVEANAALELVRQAYTDAKYMVYDQVALNRQATATKAALRLGGVGFNSRKV